MVLTSDCAPAVERAARERGLLVNPVRPDVLRLAPPLIVTESEIDEAVEALRAALAAVHAEQERRRRLWRRCPGTSCAMTISARTS